MKYLFYLSLLIVIYVYAGYPLLVFIVSRARRRRVRKSSIEPAVTILIAAHNEEDVIGPTLENKFALNYPAEKLEIIVISDGSSDRTDEIVARYKNRGVRLIRQEQRAGKTSALNRAAQLARGEILVFSDANSLYEREAVRQLVANFADHQVGYVTGKMVYTDPDGTLIGDGCTAYMKYENALRRWETSLGSVVGVDGGIDAVRKKLYRAMNPDQLPDFVLPLRVVEQGYRVVHEPGALLQEPALRESSDEYRMRVRVSLRALWALSDMRSLLSFYRHPLFAWQLWSHKVLRYICFVFLLVAYLANLALWGEGEFYRVFFMLQTTGYLGASVSIGLGAYGWRVKALYLAHYFLLLNAAAAQAFVKFLLRQKQVVWTPRKG